MPARDAVPVVSLAPRARPALRCLMVLFLLAAPCGPMFEQALVAASPEAPLDEAALGPVDDASLDLVPPDPSVYRGRAAPALPAELPSPAPAGRVAGDFEVIAVLIEFQDVQHSSSNTPSSYNSSLFGSGLNDSSVRNYYLENSYGALKVKGNITAVWYKSDFNMADYGADGTGVDNKNGAIYRLVTEAVRKADPDVDFSRYDRNGDGFIDHLCVVHAGQGQEASLNPNAIWSHKWYDYEEPVVDGVAAGPYTMLSELSPVGTFAHEFAHDLGLVDLYDQTMGTDGAGIWDLMATGSWADAGNTPAHLSAWSKMRAGWLTPLGLAAAADNLSLPAVESSAVAYRIAIDPPNEYFLIENRQRTGWDRALPASGMLIWHIDERVKNNNDRSHRLVDLEEMDEIYGDSPVDAGDPWHDSAQGFCPDSVPSTAAYAGYSTSWAVHRIGASGPAMNFSVRCVDVDMAVTRLDYSIFQPERIPGDIRATVINHGGRPQTGVPVTLVVARGEVFFCETILTRTLQPGWLQELSWSWTPLVTGNYIVAVRVAAPKDEVPENDEKTGVLRVTAVLFFDDVEKGQGGWESGASVPLVPALWHIVNRTDRYGDSFSPNHSWWCGYDATGKYTRGANFVYYYLESPVIDLTRMDSAVLAFRLKYDISTGLPYNILADTASVEGSANLGGSWKQLDSFSGNGGNWSLRMYDLTQFSKGLFQFRFVLRSNALMMGLGWYVDDIAVFSSGDIYDVALGLSPGAAAALPRATAFFNLTVLNSGNREDTFILTAVAAEPGAVAISLNRSSLTLGLFGMAQVRLAARVTDKAEAGALLTFRITAVSKGNPRVSITASGHVLVLQEYGLLLDCGGSPLSAGPCEEAVFEVNLTNLGNGPDRAELGLLGGYASCASFPSSSVALNAWELKVVLVKFAAPANATAGSKLAFCITALSASGAADTLRLEVIVARVSGARLEARSDGLKARPGGSARFDIELCNLGNAPEEFVLTAQGDPGWLFNHDAVISLEPFYTCSLSLEVRLPAEPAGGNHSFTLRAAAEGGAMANLTLTVVVVMPDVYVRDLKLSPEIIQEGDSMVIRMTVGNGGGADASGVTVSVFDNGKRIKMFDLGVLSAGSSDTLTLSQRPGRGNHQFSALISTPDRELSSANNEAQADGRVSAKSSAIPGPGMPLLAAALLFGLLLGGAAGRRGGRARSSGGPASGRR